MIGFSDALRYSCGVGLSEAPRYMCGWILGGLPVFVWLDS